MVADVLHQKGEEAREAGNFVDSLKYCEEASVEYAKGGNSKMLAETLCSKALTYRHLAESTGKGEFLVLAKYAAKTGVKIAEKASLTDGKAIPLYTLGKVYESKGKYDDAAEEIKDAIECGDPSVSKTMLAEMKTRLDSINYRKGDQQALESFNADLQDLINGEFSDDYVKNVWISGAYMHMAEALISKGEGDKARDMLDKARVIIDSDARLTLRAKQLAKIETSA